MVFTPFFFEKISLSFVKIDVDCFEMVIFKSLKNNKLIIEFSFFNNDYYENENKRLNTEIKLVMAQLLLVS